MIRPVRLLVATAAFVLLAIAGCKATAATAPQTLIASHPRNPSDSPAAVFRFASGANNALFQCRLDRGRYRRCTSPKRYRGLRHGLHTFRVRALVGGAVDPTPATFRWRINLAFKQVTVGPGLVDASVRQLVRTKDGRLFIFAADDTAQKNGIGPGVIRAWRPNLRGVPTRFAEVDGRDRPSATGTAVLGSPDVRLDRNGVAHLLYVDESTQSLVYQRFSTVSETWGPRQVVASDVTLPTKHLFRRGQTANAIVLGPNDEPHIVYAAGPSLLYRRKIQGGWSPPVVVANDSAPLHPQLAAAADGNLHLAWLDDVPGDARIRYATRTAAGWREPETVAERGADEDGVLGNDNLDQGPSIIVSAADVPYVLYLSCCAPDTSHVRVKFRSGGEWALDAPSEQFAHTPQIYGRGRDVYVFLGHDAEIRFGYLYRLNGMAWSAYKPLTTLAQGQLDGSASVRWDPARETNPGIIDVAFFDEDDGDTGEFLPRLYYMAVLPTRVP